MSEEPKIEDEVTKEFILDIAEEEGLKIVKKLMKKGEATDEDIAEEMELDLNNVRKILYKLYDNGLADYSRSRDEQSGWITYNWKLTLENVDNVLEERKRNMLEELKERLEFEKNNVFYACPDQHTRLTFEEATDIDFECHECGKQMIHYENDREIEELEERIEEIQKTLNQKSYLDH